MGTETILLAAASAATLQTAFLVFMFVWLLFVGGCVGSFMNVVIYRLPAGISTAKPGSRCPHCCHAIRFYDNIPVISWFVLRAKCRDCKAPISGRYASVEAFMAIVIVSLAIVEVYLPTRTRHWVDPQEWTAYWGRMAVHGLLISTAVCSAFMEFDRRRVPARLFLLASLSGLTGIVLIREPLVQIQFFELDGGPLAGLRDCLIGAVGGWFIAPIVLRANTANRRFRPSRLTITLAGGVLGWQALLFFAPIAAGLSWCVAVLSRSVFLIRRIPPSASVVASLLLLLFLWPAFQQIQANWRASFVGQDRADSLDLVVILAAAAVLLSVLWRPLPSSLGNVSTAR